jgi:hypothetical protein
MAIVRGDGLDVGGCEVGDGSIFVSGIGVGAAVGVGVTSNTGCMAFSSWTGSGGVFSGLVGVAFVSGFRFLLITLSSKIIYR